MAPASRTEQQLEKQVCFALYSASRAVTQLYRPVLDVLGVTYPQYLVLLALWQHGPLTVKELGTHLELDSGTLSPLLKRLEAAGLVRRGRRAEDERSVAVALTEQGAALRDVAANVPRTIARATGLSRAELAELRSTLRRITDTVNQLHLDPVEIS
jgi:DNA-binding MarR family transcriptional regulator